MFIIVPHQFIIYEMIYVRIVFLTSTIGTIIGSIYHNSFEAQLNNTN